MGDGCINVTYTVAAQEITGQLTIHIHINGITAWVSQRYYGSRGRVVL